MTRLTKTIRDHYVNAIMRDIPIDNWRERAEARCLDATHKALRENGIDPEVFEKILALGFAERSQQYVDALGCVYCRSFDTPDMTDLIQAKRNDDVKRKNAKSELAAFAASHTTLKSLREAAPEFAKYLPDDDAPRFDRSVPVVQFDAVAFAQKAGWSK